MQQKIVAKGLPRFRPILRAWVEVLRRYHEQMEDDHAWNYHERAQIGFLAAATWLAGGVGLEEWRTPKALRANRREGRCDLYLYREPFGAHIEAKHAWIRLGRGTAGAVGQVKGHLAKAIANARDLPANRDERRLGVLFAAPVIPRSGASDARTVLERWLEAVEREVPADALAWVFDDGLLERRRVDVYPGTLMLVREVGRRNPTGVRVSR